LFDEVERQHPYSVWARRSQLMSAFSYYLSRDYTESIASAQRFLSIHPGNRDAPYATYLIAIAYYEQITDVTRDQKITRQALDALGELIAAIPTRRYAADARLKVDLVADHLAGKEMEIGRFYQRRADWLASVIRFRKVIDEYDTTSHVPEALERLTESYLALGVPEEARKSAAVLGANYPGSNGMSAPTSWSRQRRRPPDWAPPRAEAIAVQITNITRYSGAMLSALSIRDVVLIEALDLDFEAGLGALTGETGAGKSILLDALGLALGRRAESSLVRQGATQSVGHRHLRPQRRASAAALLCRAWAGGGTRRTAHHPPDRQGRWGQPREHQRSALPRPAWCANSVASGRDPRPA
jgi:outer membrane protein assembly factor BamD